MFDRQTDSLWNQFTGKPVAGPLSGSDIELAIRPVIITSWDKWRRKHPSTRVLSLDTGHWRDYGSGVVYRDYFASPDLMFAAITDEKWLSKKSYVFGIRQAGAAKAWPLEAFAEGAVINDAIGDTEVVLIGDAATRTVRAYERQGLVFSAMEDPNRLSTAAGQWTLREDKIVGPNGRQLPRVPGHISYWFAWNGFIGAESELYRPDEAG